MITPPTRRGKPLRHQQKPTGPEQASRRGRPLTKSELNKASRHHVKRKGRPKKRNKTENLTSPLTYCPPPMIHPFKDPGASIEWGERLDTIPGSYPETKSCVFKVTINSEPFVLKIFKFFNPLTLEYDWSDRLGEDYPLSKAIGYTDPFYAECRAYGRIQEARDKGEITEKIATKCHGYLFLDADAQRWLENEGIDLGTENVDDELLSILGGAGRPRAIVKDFEAAGPDLDKQTPQQIRRIFRRVWLLNKLGIYNRDVRADNFRNGWLVDFDSSYTLPHDIYNILPKFEVSVTQGVDVAKFEEMLEEAGIDMKFLAPKRYNLRPRLIKNLSERN
ncbi:kinetochore Sim4 complex subunit FTA2-domain-containing protein [Nemania sp. NC0429]|nr:kinetochore Sim4 complex subunit FTA2-domain-containing protein [Nemania sp. NC0429]